MGMVVGWAKGLEHVYRAADCTITAHQIDVRTVREAMACGCPVVRITDIENTGVDAALKSDRNYIRKQAEQRFNPETTAKQFREILDGITD